ncbi:MAG: SpoIIE family protein phosphatase [Streptosporangiaceae bacterium]
MSTSGEMTERSWRGWMSFIAEASDLLAGTLDPERTLALIAQLFVPRLSTWCAVYNDEADPRPAYVWHTDEEQSDLLRHRLITDGPPPQGPPSGWHGEVACTIPLIARGRPIGAIALGRTDRFSPDHIELAEELSRRSALALDNARLFAGQTAMSKALQRSLLPPDLPEVPGIEVGVVYRPADHTVDVGGDFYDLFACKPGPDGARRWRFAIGDVCGTGPEAAAVTGLARHALRILAGEGLSVPVVMERLNRLILDEGPRGRLLTLLHGEITEGGGLGLVCAGHPLPLLLSPDGTVVEAATPQPLLGVLDEVTFEAGHLTLLPGQVLLSVTDGVTERRDGELMLGDGHGLEAILADCAGLSAGAVAAAIDRRVRDFGAEPGNDDMAIVVLRAAD